MRQHLASLHLRKQTSILFLVILLGASFSVCAQRIKNPSFEGYRGEGLTPAFWENCGAPLSTPDTQPGAWGVSLPPDHGNSYLGLVFRNRDNGSFESVTQTLSYPFHKDSTYTFEISLAFDPDYETPNFRKPGILKIWGGNATCATSENLWNSPVITHKNWQTYIVSFSPRATHSAITLQAYFATLPYYNGDILVDNIRNIKACPKPKPFLGSDVAVCADEELVLDASSVKGPYLWQDGSTSSKLKVSRSGKYWVQAIQGGCEVADTINVTFDEPFTIDLGPDVELCEGEQVTLALNVPNAIYKWSDNSTYPSLTVKYPGTYSVKVTRGKCVQTSTVKVSNKKCRFVIPNIITPNGDNLNDKFEIIDDYKGSWSLEIYSRWGKLIYSNKNYDNGWNASGIDSGIYYYILKSNSSSRLYKGSLTVAN